MAKRRRSVPSPFGMAFLDLLCSSLGAVILLLVMSQLDHHRTIEHLDDEIGALIDQNDATLTIARDQEDRADILKRYARNMRESLRPEGLSDDAKRQLMPHSVARNVVVVVDLSGSMSRYVPDGDPDFADAPLWMRQSGGKWNHAVDHIERFLMMTPTLERYSIVGLTSDDTTSGYPLAGIARGEWVVVDSRHQAAVDIAAHIREIRDMSPGGGSAHGLAIERVYEQYVFHRPENERADTILLVTDGLPNFGSEPRRRVRSDQLIYPDERRRHAREVTRTLRTWYGRSASATTMPTLHVLCMPWPDDADLTFFAIQWAGATGGMMIAVPPRPE